MRTCRVFAQTVTFICTDCSIREYRCDFSPLCWHNMPTNYALNYAGIFDGGLLLTIYHNFCCRRFDNLPGLSIADHSCHRQSSLSTSGPLVFAILHAISGSYLYMKTMIVAICMYQACYSFTDYIHVIVAF